MADVFTRQKDIQYSSRIATHIARQQQMHRLRHVISELVAHLPEHERRNESVKELTAYGCPTRMHVVRLLAPMLERENHTKDMDFSASGIRQRWEAGFAHTKHVLEQRPWEGEFDALAGVILHEREERLLMAAE
jgi:NTE family protein